MNELLETYTKKENNIFQTGVWESFQQALERDTFWVSSGDGDVLVIKMPLFRNLSYLYCPRAPQTTEDGWKLFLNRLKEIGKRENCVFVRVEPMKVPNGILAKLKFKHVRKYSPLSKQYSPMCTLLLDISESEEKILAQMKPKCRYNIKVAAKKEVIVRSSKDEKDLIKFYELSREMEKRNYYSHSYEHYQKLFNILVKNNAGELFVAEHENEVLSAIIVSYCGEVAIYLHGASSDNKRDLMPNHLIQCEAIKKAKTRGCTLYDFWGIAPDGVKNHDWAGITRFKAGFGGEKVQLLGAFDFTFKPIYYIIFCLVNFMRKAIKK